MKLCQPLPPLLLTVVLKLIRCWLKLLPELKKPARRFILWGWPPTAVFIVTSTTCTPYLIWLKSYNQPTSVFTRLVTVVTRDRLMPKNICLTLILSFKNSVLAVFVLSLAVITLWIETTGGSGSKNRIELSLKVSVQLLTALKRPSRLPIVKVSPMSLSSRQLFRAKTIVIPR